MGRRTGVDPDRPLAPVNVVRDALPVPLYPPPAAPTAFFGSTLTCSTSCGSTLVFTGSGGGVGAGCGAGGGVLGDPLPMY